MTIDPIEARVWRPGGTTRFAPTTVAEREALATLIPALIHGARAPQPPDPSGWSRLARDAGFEIEDWQVGATRYWALLELPDQRRGAGAYLFRVGPDPDPGPELLLQAPQAFFDVGTERIAARLFFEPPPGRRPRALFSNTIHRYQTEAGQRVKRADSPADVAHNPDHAFNAATAAFAAAVERVLVVQLHGFGDSDDELAGVAMVVSAGDDAGSSPRTAALATALDAAFGPGVKRFPEDTDKLGATTNVQGRALRRQPGAEFVHIEMSSQVRATLQRSAEARARFGRIVFNTAPETP